jgi:hypothetical protein
MLITIIVLILLVYSAIRFQRNRNRENLKAGNFDPAWGLILQKNLALYKKLPNTLKHKLHGLINVFLHEKIFSGYNGLQINDEIRVTIAAQACMLLLNRDDDFYPGLKNIYVYPGAFKSKQTRSDGMIRTIEETVRIGESWELGQVILSWQHSKQGAMSEDDGHNVVYHEFAHQLDREEGAINGTPLLGSAENYTAWSKVFSEEYIRLREEIRNHKKSLIDDSGAESEGEFFAVVTELFFERPQLFEQEHPALYEELKKFYRLNPVEWV